MQKKYLLFIAVFLVLISHHAYSQTFANVSAFEFKRLLASEPGVLLDTRSRAEYAQGYIEGSQLFDLQDPQIKDKLLQLPKDKPLYLYCYSGSRSRSVAAFLSQNSYTKVYNLQRGLIDWNNSGFAVVNASKPATTPQVDAFSVQQYGQIITSSPLVFIDFYAPWCAPCKQMMPMVDELSKQYAGKVKIVKINGDASKELMKAQNIESVPMLMFYRNGKVVYSKAGKVEKAELEKLFDDQLSK